MLEKSWWFTSSFVQAYAAARRVCHSCVGHGFLGWVWCVLEPEFWEFVLELFQLLRVNRELAYFSTYLASKE
jgi:hypothetical protein